MTTNIRVKYKDTRIKQSVKDKNYNNTNNNIKIHIKEGSNETKKMSITNTNQATNNHT